MATKHWLVRIDFAGRSYLWSDLPVAPVDSDGRAWPHLGGLPDLRIPSDYDPFQQVPRVRSVSMEVVWPPEDPIGPIIEEGHRFPDSDAEVSIWEEGTPYDAREVVIKGNPSEPEYGEQYQPIAFSIQDRPWKDAGSTHTATERVTADTWSANVATGEPWYPKVIGRPGWTNAAIGPINEYEPGSPALIVESSSGSATRLLIAAHPVGSAAVSISDGTTTESFDVEQVVDGLGQLVSTVDVSSAATIDRTASAFTTIWDAGYSMIGPDGDASGAGDVLLWAVSMMDYPVDYGSLYAWRTWLNRFKLAGYVNEATDVWDLIQDGWLQNLLPVSIMVRDGKLRVVPWRYDAVAAEAMRHIEVTAGLTVAGRIVHERDRVRSKYVVTCGLKADGDARVVATLSDDVDNTGTQSTASSVISKAVTFVGQVSDATESAWAGNIQTAFLSLHWRSIRGLVTRYVQIQDISGEYDDLDDGDVVTLTYAGAGITNALGLVSVDRVSTVAQTLNVAILPNV